MTAPKENGKGALLAMQRALKNAKLSPDKVDYINAHGTSTVIGDAAENAAIKTLLLGSEGKQNSADINISSTKGAIGHLLGGAGAVEAVFSILSIHEVRSDSFLSRRHRLLISDKCLQRALPPTVNLENTTEEFDCNYVPNVAQDKDVNVVLTNSFGFGGTNSSLCFAKYEN